MIDIIAPKKSLGQNFLTDNNISRKIIGLLELQPDDNVVEIGPGTGALTSLLLAHDIKLTAVELDKRAVELLRNKFADTSLQIINDDIRKVNLSQLAGAGKMKSIGNIPYYISADILFLMFENYKILDRTIIMVQKEVAKRVVAKPDSKDYGILALAAALVGTASVQFDVSPNCFYPKPKVTSSVLKITYYDEVAEGIVFYEIMKLIKAAFSQRRKTLRNSLKMYLSGFSEEKISLFSAKFKELLEKRAENLTKEDFIEMYLFLSRND